MSGDRDRGRRGGGELADKLEQLQDQMRPTDLAAIERMIAKAERQVDRAILREPGLPEDAAAQGRAPR